MAENLTDTNVGNIEYIRKADAIDTLEAKKDKSAKGDIGCFYNTIIQNAIDALNGLPSADVVQVVRCKDCKHFYFADNRIPQEQRYVCEISGEIWKPDSFCSYGERKE